MASALDTAGLLALLEKQELVLVPNAAAASSLRGQFDARQRTRGLRAWEPASVLAWDGLGRVALERAYSQRQR